MTVQTIRKVDPQDVALVAAIEPKLKELMAAIEAADPAMERLAELEYPAAQYVSDAIGSESVYRVVQALEYFSTAKGDWGAFDYQNFVVQGGMTVNQAADEILQATGTDRDLERVDALRKYAATAGGRS